MIAPLANVAGPALGSIVMRPSTSTVRRALVLTVALVGLAVIPIERGAENATSAESAPVTTRADVAQSSSIPMRTFDEPTLSEAIKADSEKRWYAVATFTIAVERSRESRSNTPRAVSTSIISPSGDGSVWYALAECESSGDWSYNGPSGFDGGIQFEPGTWIAYGGGEFAPYAWGATPEQQITVGRRVLAAQGPGAWPVCSRRVGLVQGS